MKKEDVRRMASEPGSESGPLGAWPRARLAARPEAGAVVREGNKWYVAVAGVRREGTRGDFGGLYARWVEVPSAECEEWADETR